MEPSWKEIVKLPPEEKVNIKYDDPRLDDFTSAVEARYELPPGLIKAVKNAGERSNTTQESPKGAKGVMQFIDSTRKAYEHDYKDPLASIDAAGRYFQDLLKKYKGNVKAAVAHYNGGTRSGKAALAGEEIPFEETRNYLKRIKEYMSSSSPEPDYGNRVDGEKKGRGFLGELQAKDGRVSTEISIGVNIDGEEVEIPTLIPTLTQKEIDHLLETGEPTEEIVEKAVKHAVERKKKGLGFFKEVGE